MADKDDKEERMPSRDGIVSVPCYLCGQETETYVEDCAERGPHGECYFKKKVPLCEGCFKELYPSQENIQKLSFWLHVFPVIEKVQT